METAKARVEIKEKASLSRGFAYLLLVARAGIEPATHGFSVFRCGVIGAGIGGVIICGKNKKFI
jgi:hypothetical protein